MLFRHIFLIKQLTVSKTSYIPQPPGQTNYGPENIDFPTGTFKIDLPIKYEMLALLSIFKAE
jgi:hypothetical protein